MNDYEIGIRHNLESIDILNDDGTLSEKAELFVGLDRFVARKKAVKMLRENENLVKEEDYMNKVGYSERSNAVIEPKLSMQWFLKMQKLAEPALENVMNDNIKIYPPQYKNTYKHWMENVRDWCISRQLWWGHRIPVFYLPNSNEFVVAENAEDAVLLAREKTGDNNLQTSDLRQDEDVLDTWFSSWLWPISVFDGIRNPENEDYKYYYPTNDLVTAPEILFFWVARMIIAGYEWADKLPFRHVYLHGIVRDKQRRKMSKSLGNSPDPIKLMEIYGADGVRVGMLLCSPAGGDLLFDEALTEQGRNFGNKIWNAFRLVKGWTVDADIQQPEAARKAIEWFDNKLNKTIETLEQQFDEFRISEALMTVYRLFWDDFSSWYLEMIKPAYQKPIDKKTIDATMNFFDRLLKLLHPFMPFISEEIWHQIEERKEGDSILLTSMPKAEKYSAEIIDLFEATKETIAKIRSIRKDKNIAMKETLELFVKPNEAKHNADFDTVITKLCNLSKIEITKEKVENATGFMVRTSEFFVPLEGLINVEEEIQKLQKELLRAKNLMKGTLKKLDNKRFVDNAPAKVIEMERKKLADAETRIKAIEAQINTMKV